MSRKPSFTLQQSEGGIKRIFDAFYRQGPKTAIQADITTLFMQGSGLKSNVVPCKNIHRWIVTNKYLERSIHTQNALILNQYWDIKEIALKYFNWVMGIPDKPEKVEATSKATDKAEEVKESVESQVAFSDSTGFHLKWMKTQVYYIKDSEFCRGTVTGFRTMDDMESIELQIDCDIWIPKDLAYSSLEDFTRMINNKLKKL